MVKYTHVRTIQGIGDTPVALVYESKSYVHIEIASAFDAYFWAPALVFATMFEVTEVITMYVHASCTLPTRCTSVALRLKGI